jgi:hypothetical protein
LRDKANASTGFVLKTGIAAFCSMAFAEKGKPRTFLPASRNEGPLDFSGAPESRQQGSGPRYPDSTKVTAATAAIVPRFGARQALKHRLFPKAFPFVINSLPRQARSKAQTGGFIPQGALLSLLKLFLA